MSWFRHSPDISQPVIWGKIPASADYLRHNISTVEVELWQRWLDTQVEWLRQPVKYPHSQQRHDGWSSLTPKLSGSSSPTLLLPWSFVLRPGFFSFAQHNWLVGIVIVSEDRINRPYPLVIYQQANLHWLQHHLADSKDWLFWLAQLARQHAQPQHYQPANNLIDDVMRLHHASQSGRRWFWHIPSPATAASYQALVGPFSDDKEEIPLYGVPKMPWTHWPQRVWKKETTELGWCWQQDRKGGFVDVKNLMKLNG